MGHILPLALCNETAVVAIFTMISTLSFNDFPFNLNSLFHSSKNIGFLFLYFFFLNLFLNLHLSL